MGDSGSLASPLIHVNNQMTRHLAALGEPQSLPPFTRAWLSLITLTLTALGRNHIVSAPCDGYSNAWLKQPLGCADHSLWGLCRRHTETFLALGTLTGRRGSIRLARPRPQGKPAAPGRGQHPVARRQRPQERLESRDRKKTEAVAERNAAHPWQGTAAASWMQLVPEKARPQAKQIAQEAEAKNK